MHRKGLVVASLFTTAVTCLVGNAALGQTRAGGEFRVNTITTGQQLGAECSANGSGDLIVVWRNDYFGRHGAGQRFDPSGNRRGGEFKVNTGQSNYYADGSVAVGAHGGFVVAWNLYLPYPSDEIVHARRYNQV